MVYVPAEFRRQQVVVVGDTMLDRSLRAVRSYRHPGEDVIVISAYREFSFPGGAANIAANVRSLGGEALHVGVVGDDENAAQLRAALRRCEVRPLLVVDPARPTTTKLRIHHEERPVVRVDTESTEPIGGPIERTLLSLCRAPLAAASALVVSDYGKGVVTTSLARSLIGQARAMAVPCIVDSKSLELDHFKGCTVFRSNRHELESVLRRELFGDGELSAAARSVSRTLGGAAVVVTDADRGILLVDPAGNHCHVDPPRRDVVRSVVGAGDTVTACLALAWAAGMDPRDAIDLAVRAAADAVASADTTAVRGHLR
jgi:D-beta-D-heptose 7-phosphate kinase/D-beta-D-heptose 1-phosphate adenosyltransferase